MAHAPMDALDNELEWMNREVHTPEETYVCRKSTSFEIPPDTKEFRLEFEARSPMDGTHSTLPTKVLRLRTSSFKISHDDNFFLHLSHVIEGQLLQAKKWDELCIEIYET